MNVNFYFFNQLFVEFVAQKKCTEKSVPKVVSKKCTEKEIFILFFFLRKLFQSIRLYIKGIYHL